MDPVKSAAAYLGISQSKLYQMVSRREIPFYKVGGKILFKREDLDAYLESCRVGAAEAKTKAAPASGTFTALNTERMAKAWKDQGML